MLYICIYKYTYIYMYIYTYKCLYIYLQCYMYVYRRVFRGGGKGGNTPPWGSQGEVIPPPELQPQMETAHFPRH